MNQPHPTTPRPRLIAFASFLLFAVAGGLLLFGLAQLMARLPFAASLLRAARTGVITWSYLWLLDSACLLVTILLCLVAARLEHRPVGNYGLPLASKWATRVGQGILLGLILAFADIAITWLLGAYTFGSLALSPLNIVRYGFLWAIGFLLVALFEEYFFRGYSLHALTRAIGFWPAAGLLGVIFAGLHLGNPGEGLYGAIDVLLYALFASLTLLRTGNLWFAVGLHAAWDFSLTFLYAVPGSGVNAGNVLLHSALHGPVWKTGGSAGPEGSAIGIAVLLAAYLGYAMWKPSARNPSRDNTIYTVNR